MKLGKHVKTKCDFSLTIVTNYCSEASVLNCEDLGGVLMHQDKWRWPPMSFCINQMQDISLIACECSLIFQFRWWAIIEIKYDFGI